MPALLVQCLRCLYLHVNQWEGMEDEAIIAELVAIRGIGRWTAEMFLIFHLLRARHAPA